jgi:hypothetical protein
MKIGDKVRVKSDYSEVTSNAYSRRGETGTILGFNNIVIPDLHITYVKFDSDEISWNVFTSALELIEEEFIIPKQWYINVTTKEQAKIVGRWFDHSEFACAQRPNFYEKEGDLGIFGGVSPGDVYGNRVGTLITFEQFEKYILNNKTNMKKEIIGYKSPIQICSHSRGTLYIVYHGNESLYIPEPTKNETYKAYYSVPKEIAETWEPVYKEDQTKTLVLGTGRIKVVIGKGVVVVDGENVIVYKDLLNVYRIMTDNNTQITGSETSYTVSFPKGVKIGCSEFEISEIEQIINTYNELNK